MSNDRDRNYVSFWFWMFALFIAALPCVGIVMVFVWAFVGENESRKNYFRAVIAWALIAMAFWAGLMLLGFWPEVHRQIQQWLQRTR